MMPSLTAIVCCALLFPVVHRSRTDVALGVFLL